MKPCKHLDYDPRYGPHCELVTLTQFSPPVKHWRRLVTPYPEAPINVQFCKLRGRINSIFDCYREPEPCNCYATADAGEEGGKP